MNCYSSQDNYVSDAIKFQSVLNVEETQNKLENLGKSTTLEDIEKDRVNTYYSCPDNYFMGTIQDNQITKLKGMFSCGY